MDIKLVIAADEALLGVLSRIADGLQGGLSVKSALPQETKERLDNAFDALKARKMADEIKAQTPEPEPAPEPTPELEPEPTSEPEPSYTLEQVRKALSDVAKAKGRDEAKKILSSQDVESVSQLAPEQYSTVMHLVKEAAQDGGN